MDQYERQDLKRKKIPDKFETFRIQYFKDGRRRQKDEGLKEFAAEIEWLYQNVDNEYDLAKRMYPFWSKKFEDEMYDFMESNDSHVYLLIDVCLSQCFTSVYYNDAPLLKAFSQQESTRDNWRGLYR